jgi:hypothetical protein
MDDFSFDEWAKLYETDPVEFERRRKDLLEQQILKAPIENRNGLRLLQMECDAIRNTHGPMESAAIITTMASEKLKELKAPLTQLRSACEDILHPPK